MDTEPTDFSGGVAVITGAGSGIGAALAVRAVGLGMKVVLADVHEDAIGAASRAFNEAGAETVAECVDVRDFDQAERLAQRVYGRWGTTTLLVNNAGIMVHGNTWEIPPTMWDDAVGVNLNGVFYGIRAFVPRMLAQPGVSHVVNVASIAALRISEFRSAYCATKSACLVLTETVAREVAEISGTVRFSAVVPGPVRTMIFRSAVGTSSDDAGARKNAESAAGLDANGLDPLDAADLILDRAARGDLRIHTHPAMSEGFIHQRTGELLAGLD
ncbi:MAG TPA: SDR family NAD(P)-dependent oxidoreductase [Amycolatopsis sp.]|nr:SDR family NAD(P)-dependent oxidoreductase [Amycolatopsis sp.]